MKTRPYSFGTLLLRNYILSTFIALSCITLFVAGSYTKSYNRDMRTLMDTSLFSINSSVNTYLKELEQASMMPYYNDSFIETAIRLRKKNETPNSLDRLDVENAVGNMLTFSQYTRDDIIGSLIVSGDDCLFNSTSAANYELDDSYRFSMTDWYQEAIAAKGRAAFLVPAPVDYYIPSGGRTLPPIKALSIVRAIMDIRTREPLCVFRIDAGMEAFEEMFDGMEWHVPSILIITDHENRMIYTSQPLNTEKSLELKEAGRQIVLNQEKWLVYSSDRNDYRWNVYVLLNAKALNGRLRYILLISVAFYLVGLIAAAVLFRFYSHKMISTIDTINRMSNDIREGHLDDALSLSGGEGMEPVVNAVRYLAEQLEATIKREYELQVRQKEFELNALQSQINPHFLFNSLNGLIGLNQIGQSEMLNQSLRALINLLRYTLGKSGESTVKTEMDFLRDYCELQRLRFRDRLNYSITYDPETAMYPMPKLILQPLVENAVIHGIEPCKHNCFLNIDLIHIRNRMLMITIEDDGVGFDPDNTASHIGIDNVRQRVLLLNRQNQFQIESSPGVGTVITIGLQVSDSNEEMEREK